MNFVFNQMAAYNDTPYAPMMVQSLLKYMPGSAIAQISDRDAKWIEGVAGVIRGKYVYDEDIYARDLFDRLLVLAEYPLIYCDADMK